MIYIDSDFKCHTNNPEGIFKETVLSENAIVFFDTKCTAFIEGYRVVPSGEIWMRSDGKKFTGEMITPWKPYAELAAAQAQYERDQDELVASYLEGVNSV